LKLNDSENATLKELAAAQVGSGGLSSLAAYGSKVAGYARPDSDYDLIAVARKFGEGVRYRYTETPVAASVLIVDEGLLLDDARSSYLGEFVVGRLLNVYEPIVNGELLRTAELEYKTRVIVEGLVELTSDYGEFCRDLIIPYEYFLFNKLHKRSVVYPPALFSYVQTYSCSQAADNKEVTIAGFREAAAGLADAGFLTRLTDGVRVVPEKMKGDAFTKLSSLFSLTARGVTQYAVHGYAGRVGLNVFRREATSKLKRIREAPKALRELEKPKSLLRLEEGTVLADSSRIEDQLARMLGFENFTSEARDLGEPYSTTRVVKLASGTMERSFVVKNFADLRSLKWALLGFWAISTKKFSMTPMARLEREYRAGTLLREAGIKTPSTVAVAPDERMLVKDFIEGETLSHVIDGLMRGGESGLDKIENFAEVLVKAHTAGICLGDAKASNVVVAADGLYLTDLEQAVQGGDPSWDVAEFLFYTGKLSAKEERMEKVARAFLAAYAKKGDSQVIARARKTKYLRPFQPFMTPGMASLLRGLMQEYDSVEPPKTARE
jgi:tRNA A-37 threonylcarbamoyl transferase component Bud32